MTVKKEFSSAEELNKYIVKGIQEKKGTDITILNLENTENAIANYFVICTGGSDAQVDAITESIEREVYLATKEAPWHKEGMKNKEWILLDFIDVVVHIFKKDSREFYSLEELWGDAETILIGDGEKH